MDKYLERAIKNDNFMKLTYREITGLIGDPVAFAVYVALKSYAEWGTDEHCFPSVQRIGERAQIKRRKHDIR